MTMVMSDSPLHPQIMNERKASRPGLSRLDSDFARPMVQEFPAPKSELFQRFHVYYLGNVAVAKPVGKERPA